MSEPVAAPAPSVANRNWLVLVPALVGAAVAVALGTYGRLHEPTGRPLYTGFFSSMLGMKAWLGTVVVVLALAQLTTALWLYGRLPWPAPAWLGRFHRATGLVAFLVSVPVAYHCLWAIGFSTYDARTLAHAVLGCAFYGAFAAKVLTLHLPGLPGWLLPIVGGTLFTTLVGIWLASSLWYFTTIAFPGW